MRPTSRRKKARSPSDVPPLTVSLRPLVKGVVIDFALERPTSERIFNIYLRWLKLEVAIGRAGPGRANSGPGQNQAGPKLARFFSAKILTAQPALKTGPVGPNSLF